jgi:hypothetical protein
MASNPGEAHRQHREAVLRRGHATLGLAPFVNVISWLKIEPLEFVRTIHVVVGPRDGPVCVLEGLGQHARAEKNDNY